MKFDEKVLTALEVLTDAAENDFELFRICTLVRDLIAPPQVEQVDEKHQRFGGVTYSKMKDGHYLARDGIHRAVWQYYHGEIPECSERYEVHHDNENKADNNISNLILLTRSEHQKIHSPKGSPVAPSKHKTFVCECCGNEYRGIDIGNNRYCPDCRPVIKTISNRHYDCPPTVYEKTCPVCGKKFTVAKKKGQLCCSLSCKTKLAWQRNEILKKTYHKVCPVCSKEFDTPYCKKIYCSGECSREATKQSQQCEKVCENCGKIFVAAKKRTRCCSMKCAAEMRERERKAAAAESPEKGTEGVNIVTEQGRD